MATNIHTYLKNRIGAEINQEENKTTFVFQKERVGFKRTSEIIFLKEVNPQITKDIVITDDELIIQAEIPSNFKRFSEIHKEDEKSRWMFAYQLVEKVHSHPYPRLNLIVCPENTVYSRGMEPLFIYYGVQGSLPPFEKNEERIWLETKAVAAAAIDGSFTFEEYLKYSEILELKEIGSSIMSMQDSQSLLNYISEQLDQLEIIEKENVRLPRKKWKITKGLSIGFGVLLLPAIIFTIIYFIHEKPKNEAYTLGHEYFLGQNYSQVVTELSPYSVKSMPYVVLYELAYSTVTNERLDEEQKKNVLSNITLQTDVDYLKYWIYIGRGEAENAVDIARAMEDGELITYGLLKRREEIKADQDLSGEEIQTLVEEIDREVEEYEKLMEEEEESDN
ncbi:type VII secretion protein EssB [Bacillus sp. Cr_A10]|uniref:type VII secretion protein EssB n=1 Tax=Bacillus sp. Cr_A10 TaxID=3033993 RepID=UPI0023D9EF17|nr:type VII secretion protein EssB [Bacillus sp. Cr_A10]MDF2065916.1 type VII secretion protein EssB [Bacillus sp. Cr_A10]